MQRQRNVGGLLLAAHCAFDGGGRLTQMTYPSGTVINYAYGSDNRVQQISVNGSVLLSGITYDAADQPVSWNFANGQQVVRAFDYAGRPTQNALYSNIASDAGDRITTMNPSALNSAQRTKNFGYDALDRLTALNDGRPPMAYTYDANGNRLTDYKGSTTNQYVVGMSMAIPFRERSAHRQFPRRAGRPAAA